MQIFLTVFNSIILVMLFLILFQKGTKVINYLIHKDFKALNILKMLWFLYLIIGLLGHVYISICMFLGIPFYQHLKLLAIILFPCVMSSTFSAFISIKTALKLRDSIFQAPIACLKMIVAFAWFSNYISVILYLITGSYEIIEPSSQATYIILILPVIIADIRQWWQLRKTD